MLRLLILSRTREDGGVGEREKGRERTTGMDGETYSFALKTLKTKSNIKEACKKEALLINCKHFAFSLSVEKTM